MTQRTEGPDLRRHLRELEREVRQLQRQSGVRPTSTRPRPTFGLLDAKGDLIVASANDTAERLPVGTDHQFVKALSAATRGVQWSDLAETWTGAQMPTTNLRRGRMVYATGLTAGNVWNGRVYVVDDLDRWKLLRAFEFVTTLMDTVTTPNAGRFLAQSLGTPPCDVEVHSTLTGCVQASSNTWGYEAIANLHRQNTTTVMRRVCVWCPGQPAGGVGARPTGAGDFFEPRSPAGGAIAYDVTFEDMGGAVHFTGANDAFFGASDSWKLMVRVS